MVVQLLVEEEVELLHVFLEVVVGVVEHLIFLMDEVEEEVKGPLEGLEGDLAVVEERQGGVQDALGGD